MRVGLELYSVSTGGASIRWYVNGTERTDATNARELEVETGAFGSELRLRAVVTPPGGASVSVERTMRPSELDLVVEGDTLIPLFYQGRALPAGGEAVAVTAIPHIAGYSNSSALSYTWTLGSTVLFNGPVKGKTRAVFTMPKTRTYLSVEVTDAEGEVLAGNTIALTSVRPELYFYEENPLRGLGERAFGEMFTLLGDETTVRAAPYFISKDIWVSNPVARWTINGGNANSGDDIRTLTLRSEGSGGEARIGFELHMDTGKYRSL